MESENSPEQSRIERDEIFEEELKSQLILPDRNYRNVEVTGEKNVNNQVNMEMENEDRVHIFEELKDNLVVSAKNTRNVELNKNIKKELVIEMENGGISINEREERDNIFEELKDELHVPSRNDRETEVDKSKQVMPTEGEIGSEIESVLPETVRNEREAQTSDFDAEKAINSEM